jgi:hypothetical protein
MAHRTLLRPPPARGRELVRPSQWPRLRSPDAVDVVSADDDEVRQLQHTTTWYVTRQSSADMHLFLVRATRPVTEPDMLPRGDVVLVKVKGTVYLHLITALEKERVQIGNNRGRIIG